MKKATLLLFTIVFVSCGITKEIVDKPIVFDEERKILSLEYLSERYGLEQDTPEIDPKMIVLHWTAIPTLKDSFDAFNPSKLPNTRPDIKSAGALNVSSHFLVDQDGTIYRQMPETLMARHVIGLNHTAIGIENVGGTENTPLTKKQLEANIWLVDYLSNKYDIEYLIGHYEYTNFVGHELWLEKDKGYRTTKTDPGKDFLEKVKQANKKHNFKQTPIKP
ncbi:N-acetyl-anhydromuramyl-L-alanine amidase AmpD [Saonia flava]|uniref:N-acetylmuramoyl-L-alanine amidase n=1 Tax=Saonia flava TaxID=523696 RepID=A0A846QW99_9FLAO|nr:peptidoglycan recognition family protein [Saonia flava]NJB69855.1 N-acetyl-anhydromuramyl-L-alanine amidase AmpD [Saonia flava]